MEVTGGHGIIKSLEIKWRVKTAKIRSMEVNGGQGNRRKRQKKKKSLVEIMGGHGN